MDQIVKVVEGRNVEVSQMVKIEKHMKYKRGSMFELVKT